MQNYSRVDRQKTIILAIVGILFALIFTWLINQNVVMLELSDFLPRWWGTEKLLSEGRSLYDLQNGIEVANLGRIGANPLWNNFYYPAHIIILIMPFVLIPYRFAHFLWTLFGLLSFFAGIWLVLQEIDWPKKINHVSYLFIVSTISVPTIQHTLWSQFNTIGLLAFGLSLRSLSRRQFALAGFWASFLTMKPQAMLLPLAGLLIWSMGSKTRRSFALVFGLSVGAMWAFAEAFQPGWVFEFWKSLRVYESIPVFDLVSILDRVWNPFQIPALLLGILWFALVWRWRDVDMQSGKFELLLAFSFGINWLIVPLLGFLHIVSAPAAIALLLSGMYKLNAKNSRSAIWTFVGLFVAGWLGFIYGFVTSGTVHNDFAVTVYTGGISISLAAFSLRELLSYCE